MLKVKDNLEESKKCNKLPSDALDGMIDWVRVLDRTGTVIYVNRAMQEDLGDDLIGKKCFDMLNRDVKCLRCITDITLLTGQVSEKEEKVHGKIFSIKSSPVRDEDGEIYAVVEVFRDVTKERKLENELIARNEKMSKDLDFARKIQKKILPERGDLYGVNVDYKYRPSEILSGDMFDIFEMDDEHIGFYISDVVGHGVTASIMTMFVKQTMSNLSKHNKSPSETLSKLQDNFMELNLDIQNYFTVFYGVFNRKTRELKYVNGGHNSIPLLVRDGKIKKLENRGLPITALFGDMNYLEKTSILERSDEIILYTDGIIEAKSRDNKIYGFERLVDLVHKNCRTKDIIEVIHDEIEQFRYHELDDDLTILKLKVL